MTDIYTSSDIALLADIGAKLRRKRLAQNITQADLARRAGIPTCGVRSLETGAGGSLAYLIKVLRALNALGLLEPFFRPEPISPVALARMSKRQRTRERASKSTTKPGEASW